MLIGMASAISTIVRVVNWRAIESNRRVWSHSTAAYATNATSSPMARTSMNRFAAGGTSSGVGLGENAPAATTPITMLAASAAAAATQRGHAAGPTGRSRSRTSAMSVDQDGAARGEPADAIDEPIEERRGIRLDRDVDVRPLAGQAAPVSHGHPVREARAGLDIDR